MTLQTPFDRGFTVYPFMFIPTRLAKGTHEYKAYVSHETIHYIRQSGGIPCFGLLSTALWLFKYLFSGGFRLQEEKLAFISEIEYMKLHNMPIRKDQMAWSFSNEYWDIISYNDAMDFIEGNI